MKVGEIIAWSGIAGALVVTAFEAIDGHNWARAIVCGLILLAALALLREAMRTR